MARFALLLGIIASPALTASAAQAREQPRKIDIPAGPLTDALAALSAQAGISLGMPEAPPARRVPAMRGRMTVQRALDRLLAGSGYVAVQLSPTSFRLERVRPVSAARSYPVPPRGEDDLAIVVTALKRRSALLDSPLTLTEISGATIEERAPVGADSATVSDLLPALTQTNVSAGHNTLFVRGVSDSPFAGFNQSSVSVQIGNSRVTYNGPDPDLRLVDVARVTVLKGPQGPLYGTGALGGVYALTFNPPDPERDAASAAAGTSLVAGAVGADGEAMVNLPIASGQAAVRAVGYASRDPGWISGRQGERAINSGSTQGGRLALRWHVTPDWTLDATVLGQRISVDDSQYVNEVAETDREARPIREPKRSNFALFALMSRVELGGDELVLALSRATQDEDSQFDASPVASLFGLAGPAVFADERHYRVDNAELRLSGGSTASLAWTLGASYLSARTEASGLIGPPGAPGLIVPDLIVPNLIVQRLAQSDSETALYAEAGKALGKQFALEAGLRLYRVTNEDELQDAAGDQAMPRSNKLALSPSLALNWRPGETVQAYARIASATRSGGSNISPTRSAYADDSLLSGEIGLRAQLPKRHLDIEASTFVSSWHNAQLNRLLDTGLVETINAGNAHIAGIEARLVWSASTALKLSTTFLAQRARLEQPVIDGVVLDDQRLPIVPEVRARAAARYRLTVRGQVLTLEAHGQYVGATHLTYVPALDRRSGGYALLGLSVATTLSNGLQLGLALDNLTDSHADTMAYGNPFTLRTQPQFTPLRPRALAVSLRKAF